MDSLLAKLDNLNVNSETPTVEAILGENGSVKVKWIDGKIGRGVFAAKDFEKGDLIMMDSPLVSEQFAYNRLLRYKACEFCLRGLETAEENAQRLSNNSALNLPHPELCESNVKAIVNCSSCGISYCSQQCLDQASKEYHSILCLGKNPDPGHPLVLLDTYWRQMHYPPESLNILLLIKLLIRLQSDNEKSNLFTRLTQFCSITSDEEKQLVEKLLGKEYLGRINELRSLVIMTLEHYKLPNIGESLTPERFLQLILLIGRNGQGIATSPFGVYVDNVEKAMAGETCPLKVQAYVDLLKDVDKLYDKMDAHVGQFLDNEGSGLYPNQAMLNHSCCPNAEIRFPHKNHIVGVVALKGIREGEEVTISYIEACQLERSRYSRNKYLMQHYFFACNCELCQSQADQEDVTSEEESDGVQELSDMEDSD